MQRSGPAVPHDPAVVENFLKLDGGTPLSGCQVCLSANIRRIEAGGNAYTYGSLADPEVPQEQRPHILGRRRCHLVSIANSDAGVAAFTNQAMDEANRAVEQLLVRQGLT